MERDRALSNTKLFKAKGHSSWKRFPFAVHTIKDLRLVTRVTTTTVNDSGKIIRRVIISWMKVIWGLLHTKYQGASPQVTYLNFEEEDPSRCHTNETMKVYSWQRKTQVDTCLLIWYNEKFIPLLFPNLSHEYTDEPNLMTISQNVCHPF